jgi:hypothetical protein
MTCIIAGTCLDFAGETRCVSERIAALERSSEGVKSFWSDPRRRRAIVLLQDRAQHIGVAIDGCRRSLTTMHSVMLPDTSKTYLLSRTLLLLFLL